MNFTQMHERLRLELLRRMQRGTLSVSLLARQTGFGQAHLSNFLRSRRQLSLEALDRVLAAQHLTAADLLSVPLQARTLMADLGEGLVPLVSHHTALYEPHVRASAAQAMLHVPASVLQSALSHAATSRRAWERFVAIRVSAADAHAMDPLLLPDAVALIDRHYTSLGPYSLGHLTLYAVRHGAHLTLRYVDYIAHRLVLRPHNIACPVDLIETDDSESPSDLVAGRVAMVMNEM